MLQGSHATETICDGNILASGLPFGLFTGWNFTMAATAYRHFTNFGSIHIADGDQHLVGTLRFG